MPQEPSGIGQANFPDQRAIKFVLSRQETSQINTSSITSNVRTCNTRDYRGQKAQLNTTVSVVTFEGLA
jgi:hypothetical protein